MQVGSVIRNYKVLSVLKPGAQGNVYVVEDLNNHEIVVLKHSFLDPSKRSEFEKVNSTWKSLSDVCEFVVKIKGFFYEEGYSYTVMEYCGGGDLETLIEKKKKENSKFTEFEVKTFIHDICSGLNALHTLKKVPHRDIKPGNILITADGRSKLADFNISRILAEVGKQTITAIGSHGYCAKEVLTSGKYSFEADIFSLGAVLYELLALHSPFDDDRGFTRIDHVLAVAYEKLPVTLGYSSDLLQLVYSLLQENPDKRPTADAILHHPLLADLRRSSCDGSDSPALLELHQQVQTLTAALAEAISSSELLKKENAALKTENAALKKIMKEYGCSDEEHMEEQVQLESYSDAVRLSTGTDSEAATRKPRDPTPGTHMGRLSQFIAIHAAYEGEISDSTQQPDGWGRLTTYNQCPHNDLCEGNLIRHIYCEAFWKDFAIVSTEAVMSGDNETITVCVLDGAKLVKGSFLKGNFNECDVDCVYTGGVKVQVESKGKNYYCPDCGCPIKKILRIIMDGEGKVVYPHWNTYTGKISNDLYEGNGIMRYADGAVYMGEWKSGKRCSNGVMKYVDGSEYVGEYDGLGRGGKGTLTYADGSVFEGEWEKDNRNGYGVLKDGQGNIIKKGFWINGVEAFQL